MVFAGVPAGGGGYAVFRLQVCAAVSRNLRSGAADAARAVGSGSVLSRVPDTHNCNRVRLNAVNDHVIALDKFASSCAFSRLPKRG